MPVGGRRLGAGRKPGYAVTKTRKEANELANDGGLTPLGYMTQVFRNEELPTDVRLDAAKSAAPFWHPRLAAIEYSGSLALLHETALDELDGPDDAA